MPNAIMHVNHVNTETLTYIQHVIFISGLYNFHCFMCGAIKTPVYMTRFEYFRICTVSWKVGMIHHHPHTKKHIINLGSECTDNFVPRSDFCLINARIVPVDPSYLINICSETTGRLLTCVAKREEDHKRSHGNTIYFSYICRWQQSEISACKSHLLCLMFRFFTQSMALQYFP